MVDGTEQAPQAPAIAVSPASLPALAQSAIAIPGVQRAGLEGGELVLHADRAVIADLLAFLRTDPRFSCEQLMDLCGVDWPERPQRFDVVYNLLSVSLNHRVRVVIQTDEQTPVPSVHRIWPVATWFEREAWDLFGIVFSGQPDLRRILTDYGFSGHPLRKDFPLTGLCRGPLRRGAQAGRQRAGQPDAGLPQLRLHLALGRHDHVARRREGAHRPASPPRPQTCRPAPSRLRRRRAT